MGRATQDQQPEQVLGCCSSGRTQLCPLQPWEGVGTNFRAVSLGVSLPPGDASRTGDSWYQGRGHGSQPSTGPQYPEPPLDPFTCQIWAMTMKPHHDGSLWGYAVAASTTQGSPDLGMEGTSQGCSPAPQSQRRSRDPPWGPGQVPPDADAARPHHGGQRWPWLSQCAPLPNIPPGSGVPLGPSPQPCPHRAQPGHTTCTPSSSTAREQGPALGWGALGGAPPPHDPAQPRVGTPGAFFHPGMTTKKSPSVPSPSPPWRGSMATRWPFHRRETEAPASDASP